MEILLNKIDKYHVKYSNAKQWKIDDFMDMQYLYCIALILFKFRTVKMEDYYGEYNCYHSCIVNYKCNYHWKLDLHKIQSLITELSIAYNLFNAKLDCRFPYDQQWHQLNDYMKKIEFLANINIDEKYCQKS